MALALAAAAPALAQQTPGGPMGGGGMGAGMPTTGQTSTTARAKPVPELAMDLVGEDDADRLFAARELRRQAVWADLRAGTGPVRNDAMLEARATLQDLRTDVLGPAREALVRFPKIRGAMADTLAALGATDALPDLQKLRATETRKGVVKRLDKAIARLSAP